jgi:uncharacterized protein involved in exopolysaccharide biosynthesis
MQQRLAMPTDQRADNDAESTPQKVVYVVAPPETGGLGDIDFKALLLRLWDRRWLVIGLTAIVVLAGAAYAFLKTPVYRAEAVLLLRENGPSFGMPSQFSQLESLADIAGIKTSSINKHEPLGILRSRGFARRFLENNQLVDAVAEQANLNIGVGGAPRAKEVSRVVDYFLRSVISVTEDKRAGLVLVAIEVDDPNIAAAWANKIVEQLNEEMRSRALADADTNVRYLSDQLKVTDIVAIQQSVSRLLELEIQKAMLAKGTEEFAFRIIDAAEPPTKHKKPRRALIVLASLLAGGMLSVVVVVVASAAARLKASTPSP